MKKRLYVDFHILQTVPPTKQEKSEPISDWRRVRIFRFLRVQQRRFLWTAQNFDTLS